MKKIVLFIGILVATVSVGLLGFKVRNVSAGTTQVEIINKTSSQTVSGFAEHADQLGKWPQSFVSPVNYANGTMLARIHVTQKPTNRPILINLCIWRNSYQLETCSRQIKITNPGVYYLDLAPPSTWWAKISNSWDWTIKPEVVRIMATDEQTQRLVQKGCGEACFDPNGSIEPHLPITHDVQIFAVGVGDTFTPPDNWSDCPNTVCTGRPVGIVAVDQSGGSSNKATLNPDKTVSLRPAHELADGYRPGVPMYTSPEGHAFAACDTVVPSSAKLQYAHKLRVPSDGVYAVWFRVFAPSQNQDSFTFNGYMEDVEFKASCGSNFGDGLYKTGQWQWISHTNGRPYGSYLLYLRANSDIFFVYEQKQNESIFLDNLLLTTDLSCVPQGENGSNCTNVSQYGIQKSIGPAVTLPDDTEPRPPTSCPDKPKGDANCVGGVSLADFAIWQSEYSGTAQTKQADFNGDAKVNLVDFEIWRATYVGTPNPPPTDTFEIRINAANHGSVELENSVMLVGYEFVDEHKDFAIRKWIAKKKNNRDITRQVSTPFPGNPPGRDGLGYANCEQPKSDGSGKEHVPKNKITATIIKDTATEKSVRIAHDQCGIIETYTIFKDSPVLRVDYERLAYDIFDDRNSRNAQLPGYATAKAEPHHVVLHGREQWLQTNNFLCPLNGTTFCQNPIWGTMLGRNDPPDGGPLSYKGNFIFGLVEEASNMGYGRVMPVNKMGIFWVHINESYEMLFYPFQGAVSQPGFTGYMFLVDNGQEDLLSTGRQIVDGIIPTE